MESLGKLQFHHQPLHLSINNSLSSFPKTLSSCSFRSLHRSIPSLRVRCTSTVASSSESRNPRFQILQSLPSRLLKSTCITFTAAAALFFVNLQLKMPAIAAPIATPSMESAKRTKDESSLEEEERAIEEHLASHPADVDALRSLMETRIKAKKLVEAIEVIDRLIELEPDEKEWPVLKANIYSYSGDLELAKQEFEEILKKDPLRVEAYHGLVMAYSDSGADLKEVQRRIDEAMVQCKKEKNNKDFRDFKLLVAQIRVIEGKHKEALKLYQELVKEEPRDFRPYLCQGIIYTLLKKKDEAEKQFEKFRKLVPKNHPYREYFVDNMVATKLFAEKAEREMAGSKI